MISNKTIKAPTNLPIPPSSVQKYDLNNLPKTDEMGWIIEQYFLRYIKTGYIPNLEQYLAQLNPDDWTCLMSYNPRQEFIPYLSHEIMQKMDWGYVLEYQPNFLKMTEWVN